MEVAGEVVLAVGGAVKLPDQVGERRASMCP